MKNIKQMFEIQEQFIDKYDFLFRGKNKIISVGIFSKDKNIFYLNIKLNSNNYEELVKKIPDNFSGIEIVKEIK